MLAIQIRTVSLVCVILVSVSAFDDFGFGENERRNTAQITQRDSVSIPTFDFQVGTHFIDELCISVNRLIKSVLIA